MFKKNNIFHLFWLSSHYIAFYQIRSLIYFFDEWQNNHRCDILESWIMLQVDAQSDFWATYLRFFEDKKKSIWCKFIKDSTMCRYACRSINNNNKWVKIERILYRINEVQTQQKIINHPFSTPHRTSTFMNKRAAYGWCRIIHDKLMP